MIMTELMAAVRCLVSTLFSVQPSNIPMASARSFPVQIIIRSLSRRPIVAAAPRFPCLHTPAPPLPSLRPFTPRRHPYSTEPPTPRPYTFEEVHSLTTDPSPSRIIIDVREASEVQQSGRIPGAYSMPITSNPDAFYLSDGDFFDRFGFEKPRAVKGSAAASTTESPYSAKAKEREASSGLNAEDGADSADVNREAGYGKEGGEGKGVEEVIFYCKAGVRSRAAARMAREWVGIKAGDMKGGWMEWEGRGGKVER